MIGPQERRQHAGDFFKRREACALPGSKQQLKHPSLVLRHRGCRLLHDVEHTILEDADGHRLGWVHAVGREGETVPVAADLRETLTADMIGDVRAVRNNRVTGTRNARATIHEHIDIEIAEIRHPAIEQETPVLGVSKVEIERSIRDLADAVGRQGLSEGANIIKGCEAFEKLRTEKSNIGQGGLNRRPREMMNLAINRTFGDKASIAKRTEEAQGWVRHVAKDSVLLVEGSPGIVQKDRRRVRLSRRRVCKLGLAIGATDFHRRHRRATRDTHLDHKAVEDDLCFAREHKMPQLSGSEIKARLCRAPSNAGDQRLKHQLPHQQSADIIGLHNGSSRRALVVVSSGVESR